MSRMKVMRQKAQKTPRAYPKVRYGEVANILPVMTKARVRRFMAKIDRSAGYDACHPYSGSGNLQGYGLVQGSQDYQGFSFLAHRVAWALANNEEPGDRVVRHSCDNPKCCNARHLLIGTQVDNMRDMKERGRARSGSAGRYGPAANAADYSAEDRALAWQLRYAGRWPLARIADHLGCHRATLRRWFLEPSR